MRLVVNKEYPSHVRSVGRLRCSGVSLVAVVASVPELRRLVPAYAILFLGRSFNGEPQAAAFSGAAVAFGSPLNDP
jgi:hypothetical protein